MLVAVCAPEILLYAAWNQMHAANQLKKAVNEVFSQKQSTEITTCPYCKKSYVNQSAPAGFPKAHTWPLGDASGKTCAHEDIIGSHTSNSKTWTSTEAFFAISGGIGVESHTFYPKPRIKFTPQGILLLAKAGLLPELDKEAIEDKSKADLFAKIFVLLQATWFVIQVISRATDHLSISLLEVHTMIHVACACCMYMCWISKPYDVGKPFLIKDPRVIELVAVFALQSNYVDFMDTKKTKWYCTRQLKPSTHHIKAAHLQSGVENSLNVMNYFHLTQSLGDHAERLISAAKLDTIKMMRHVELAERGVKALGKMNMDLHVKETISNSRDARLEGFKNLISFPRRSYISDDVNTLSINGPLETMKLIGDSRWDIPHSFTQPDYLRVITHDN